ncbi:MAG: caspase family protein [Hyphomonas sp.]|nr:caspase family protein [Hyphomonas sp.]
MWKSVGVRAAGFICLFLLLTGLPASAERLALVIGNARYESGHSLNNTSNDAVDVADALADLGFSLIGGGAQINQTKSDIVRLVGELQTRVNDDDDVVIYYSGHGVSFDGSNYILPVDDAGIRVKQDIPDLAYSVGRLLERLPDTGTGARVVILDACRNNPLPDSAKSAGAEKGLRPMEVARSGTKILYAAEPGEMAFEGTGRNSIFTASLLKHMREEGLRLADLEIDVAQDVTSAAAVAGIHQRPWSEGRLNAPFFFLPISDEFKEQREAYLSLSAGDRDTDVCGKYREFLEKYPEGGFADRVSALLASPPCGSQLSAELEEFLSRFDGQEQAFAEASRGESTWCDQSFVTYFDWQDWRVTLQGGAVFDQALANVLSCGGDLRTATALIAIPVPANATLMEIVEGQTRYVASAEALRERGMEYGNIFAAPIPESVSTERGVREPLKRRVEIMIHTDAKEEDPDDAGLFDALPGAPG